MLDYNRSIVGQFTATKAVGGDGNVRLLYCCTLLDGLPNLPAVDRGAVNATI
jgi:hypothetical protein